jgi:hypothetical protein
VDRHRTVDPRQLDEMRTHMARGGETARTHDLALAPVPDGTPDEHPGGSRVRAHLAHWRSVYLAFGLSRLLVFVVGFGSELVMRATDANPADWRPFAFAETYPHYLDVAVHGYTLQNAYDYPLLPGLMAGFHAIGIPFALTAFVISNVCFLFALIGFAKIGARFVGDGAARRAALYLAFMPFAYWFSIASTESVLLALVVGSTLLALRATPAAWLGAGALAALAAMTRPPGALIGIVLLGIAIAQLRDRKLSRTGIAAALAAGAMIPAAIAAFFAYLGKHTGDTLAAIHSQDQFNRHVSAAGPAKALSSGLQNTLGGSPGQAIELVATLGAAALLVWFAATVFGNRWEIRGWTLFGIASLLLPLATGVLWQMPRFALLIPPVFWMLGHFGANRRIHYAIVALFPLALAIKVATAVIGVHG